MFTWRGKEAAMNDLYWFYGGWFFEGVKAWMQAYHHMLGDHAGHLGGHNSR